MRTISHKGKPAILQGLMTRRMEGAQIHLLIECPRLACCANARNFGIIATSFPAVDLKGNGAQESVAHVFGMTIYPQLLLSIMAKLVNGQAHSVPTNSTGHLTLPGCSGDGVLMGH
jgi:hypothetical protein